MATVVSLESPDTDDARALIEELEGELEPLYPSESRHGYSVDKLLAGGVAFFVLRQDGVPAACGGVELVGREYAEVKRMYVRPRFRGLGLARRILDRLSEHARENGHRLLRLETGLHQKAAIALYESAGFGPIPPFGDYRDDPLSRFFEKRLSEIPYELRPIGRVESPLLDRKSAPKQGDEGAPEAVLVFDREFAEGMRDLAAGEDVLLLTWLDRARRDVQTVHPRGDPKNRERGVFSTRSPDRPNPIGLHRVRIVAVEGLRLRVRDLEAIDGTPILDVKPVLGPIEER